MNLLRSIRSGARALTDPAHRDHLVARYLGKRTGFQPFTDTAEDRYPQAFDYVRDHLGAGSRARILSFGCSTGEEVFALRARLPNAEIHGIDINARAIAAARKALVQRGGDPAIRFTQADSAAAEPDGGYDTILCMAVLRDCRVNEPGTERCDPFIRFEDFERTIADFARCLRPGGLLLIRHSNFRLSDTASAPLFRTLIKVPVQSNVRLYGPDNRAMPGITYPDMIFERL